MGFLDRFLKRPNTDVQKEYVDDDAIEQETTQSVHSWDAENNTSTSTTDDEQPIQIHQYESSTPQQEVEINYNSGLLAPTHRTKEEQYQDVLAQLEHNAERGMTEILGIIERALQEEEHIYKVFERIEEQNIPLLALVALELASEEDIAAYQLKKERQYSTEEVEPDAQYIQEMESHKQSVGEVREVIDVASMQETLGSAYSPTPAVSNVGDTHTKTESPQPQFPWVTEQAQEPDPFAAPYPGETPQQTAHLEPEHTPQSVEQGQSGAVPSEVSSFFDTIQAEAQQTAAPATPAVPTVEPMIEPVVTPAVNPMFDVEPAHTQETQAPPTQAVEVGGFAGFPINPMGNIGEEVPPINKQGESTHVVNQPTAQAVSPAEPFTEAGVPVAATTTDMRQFGFDVAEEPKTSTSFEGLLTPKPEPVGTPVTPVAATNPTPPVTGLFADLYGPDTQPAAPTSNENLGLDFDGYIEEKEQPTLPSDDEPSNTEEQLKGIQKLLSLAARLEQPNTNDAVKPLVPALDEKQQEEKNLAIKKYSRTKKEENKRIFIIWQSATLPQIEGYDFIKVSRLKDLNAYGLNTNDLLLVTSQVPKELQDELATYVQNLQEDKKPYRVASLDKKLYTETAIPQTLPTLSKEALDTYYANNVIELDKKNQISGFQGFADFLSKE